MCVCMLLVYARAYVCVRMCVHVGCCKFACRLRPGGNGACSVTQVSALLADLEHVDVLVFAAQEAVWNANEKSSKSKKKKKHHRVSDVDAGGGGGGGAAGTAHHSDSDTSTNNGDVTTESDADELALDEGLVEVSGSKPDEALDPFTELVHRRAALVGFHAVRALAMGEIRLLVYGRKNLAESGRISEIESSCVPTGFNGVGTNKGGVILKMCVVALRGRCVLRQSNELSSHPPPPPTQPTCSCVRTRCVDDTSFCFVSSHLAAHLKHVADRNQHYRRILKTASLGNADLDFDCQFHHVFWLGDLNYRVDMNSAEGAWSAWKDIGTHADTLARSSQSVVPG